MLMLWLTDVIVPSFNIDGFWTYVGATVVVWLANLGLDLVLDRKDGRTRGKVTFTMTRRPPGGGDGPEL
jgi:uncharacterized membrane protein YvlD (DUF360 family)